MPSSAPKSGPGDVDVSFVLGTGRCGSTLVHEILALHPDLAFVSNLEDLGRVPWVPRINGGLYRRLPRRWTQKGRVRFAPSEAYRLLDRTVSPMVSNPCRDLTADDVTPWMAERLRTVFHGAARAQRRTRLLHKFTGWPRVRFLDDIFPSARYIHVVRDGRAVASSWLQMPWWQGHRGPDQWHWGTLPERYRQAWEASGRSFVLLAGIAWMMLMDAFDEVSAALPADRWLQVRYEDVVTDPRAQLRRLAEFLGLERSARFEASVGAYRFDTNRNEAFRRDLSPVQEGQLAQLLGPRLRSLGYARAG